MYIYVRGLAWYSRFKLIADSKTANYPNFGLKIPVLVFAALDISGK